jgi:hypothetical protein
MQNRNYPRNWQADFSQIKVYWALLSHKKNPCEIDIKKQPITLKTPKRLAANKNTATKDKWRSFRWSKIPRHCNKLPANGKESIRLA